VILNLKISLWTAISLRKLLILVVLYRTLTRTNILLMIKDVNRLYYLVLTTQGYNIQYYSLPNDQQQTRDKYTKREYDEHPLFDVYGFGRTLSYIFFNNIVPPLP